MTNTHDVCLVILTRVCDVSSKLDCCKLINFCEDLISDFRDQHKNANINPRKNVIFTYYSQFQASFSPFRENHNPKQNRKPNPRKYLSIYTH